MPVTSGSKGLHLYAGLDGKRTYEEVRDYAKGIAEELQAEHPKLVLSQMTKARRSGKVFLDWSQNTGAKTTISPYSMRGRELPTVAAPRTWEEVEAGADDPLALEQVRFEEIEERIRDFGDLMRNTRLKPSNRYTDGLVVCRNGKRGSSIPISDRTIANVVQLRVVLGFCESNLSPP